MEDKIGDATRVDAAMTESSPSGDLESGFPKVRSLMVETLKAIDENVVCSTASSTTNDRERIDAEETSLPSSPSLRRACGSNDQLKSIPNHGRSDESGILQLSSPNRNNKLSLDELFSRGNIQEGFPPPLPTEVALGADVVSTMSGGRYSQQNSIVIHDEYKECEVEDEQFSDEFMDVGIDFSLSRNKLELFYIFVIIASSIVLITLIILVFKETE